MVICVEALVVDDHKMVCEAIAALVEKSNLVNKAHVAFSGAEALELLKEKKSIQVAMIDARMPGMSGLDLGKVILQEYPHIKIIGMTSFGDENVMNMLAASFQSILLKITTTGLEVAQCLSQVLNGGNYLSIEVAEKINNGHYKLLERARNSLTNREREILVHISRGKTAKEIAGKLNLSVTTVEDYRKAMLRKTKTSNAAELIAFAHRNGLL